MPKDESPNVDAQPTVKQVVNASYNGKRDYLMDTGAAFHCVSMSTLTPEERATITLVDQLSANGTVPTQESVCLYCADLNSYFDF